MHLLILFLSLFFLAGQTMAEVPATRFEKSSCPFSANEDLEGVECGYVMVPENRERPKHRKLRLAVAILRSTNKSPASDPLVFLSGGPGEKSVEYARARTERPFWKKLREKRDLVFFDQRGTGYSERAFCPELFEVYTAGFRGLPHSSQIDFQRAKLTECRAKLLKQGLDFSSYNSRTSAMDIDDIRKALGIKQWNLFGVSYGTRLALTAMRDTPEAIRSVILDSSSPPNVRNWTDAPSNYSRSLRLLFDQCASDVECKRAFPELEKNYYDVLQNLEKDPIIVTGLDSRFPNGKLVVDGTLLAAGIFQGLYDYRFIRLIPLMIHEMQQRNENVLKAVAEGLVLYPQDFSVGLQLAVDCYELAPFNPQREVELEQRKYPELRVFHEFAVDQDICNAWHEARADSMESLPVHSDIPTLILAGEFDPITPPSYGRIAASTLIESTFVEIPGVGHAVSGTSECTQKLLSDFLENPAKRPDVSCVEQLKPLAFLTNVHVNPAVYRMVSRFQKDPKPGFLAASALALLFLLSPLVLWPAASVNRLIRKRRYSSTKAQTIARWIASINSLVAISFLILLSVNLFRVANTNPYIVAFGLPASAAWILFLRWFVLVLTPFVVGMAIVAFQQRWWGSGARIHYACVAAALLGFVAIAFL